MKIGDLIRFRMVWKHDNHVYNKDGIAIKWDIVQPRVDDEDWSKPVLVIGRQASPNEGLWIILLEGKPGVISEENYEIQQI